VTAAILTPRLAATTAPATAAPTDPASKQAAADETTTRKVTTPRLTGRATLSADYSVPGPESGAQATPANGRIGPFDGQVIPGFSGMVDNRDGTFWAMPDNGFGAKANSAYFRLRIYLVQTQLGDPLRRPGPDRRPTLRLAAGPRDHKVGFPIVNGSTKARLLTGADFDIESVVSAPDGSFWVGEEFGPFLLHVDRHGKVLSAPAPFVGGK
jgi:glycerophosphoryl diester phosphodiesterase